LQQKFLNEFNKGSRDSTIVMQLTAII